MHTSSLALERWQVLDTAQRLAVQALQIPQAQIEFAGSVERAVAACESASEDEVAGLAILQGAHPVGFVVLSRGSKQPAWAPGGSVALTAMRIDSREQGKGLGKAALGLLDAWLGQHWPTADTLALCVDEENHAGRRAYAAAGFAEYTEPKLGRIGVVRYLSKRLAAAPFEATQVRRAQ
jgi:RimJ/RimL family protein N-acetyltransferase